jgi:hypothetical protein
MGTPRSAAQATADGPAELSVAAMRTLLIVATAFVALTATALAASGKSPTKLSIVAVGQVCGGADLPPADGSPGDVLECRARLQTAKGHKSAGRAAWHCGYTGSEAYGDVCTAVASLRHGDLTLAGFLSHKSATSTWSITGGTGAYATARGSVEVKQLSETKTAVTIHLR